MKSLGLPDPIEGIENLAKDALSAVSDLTKQAVTAVMEKLVFNPIKAISLGVLKAIFSVPTIPLSVRGETTRPLSLNSLNLKL